MPEHYLRFANTWWQGILLTYLLLDVSPSMGCTDYAPSRLDAAIEAVKRLAASMARHRSADRLGVVTFHAIAEVAMELTLAAEAVATVAHVLPKVCSGRSTNISAPMLLADGHGRASLKKLRTKARRRMILLTDGKHNTGYSPQMIADRLKANGVHIDVIGIGLRRNLNENQLRSIASIGRDGLPSYAFIGDSAGLLRKMDDLGRGRLRAI